MLRYGNCGHWDSDHFPTADSRFICSESACAGGCGSVSGRTVVDAAAVCLYVHDQCSVPCDGPAGHSDDFRRDFLSGQHCFQCAADLWFIRFPALGCDRCGGGDDDCAVSRSGLLVLCFPSISARTEAAVKKSSAGVDALDGYPQGAAADGKRIDLVAGLEYDLYQLQLYRGTVHSGDHGGRQHQ